MNLDEAFKLIANKLTEEKIPWWLECGSLLGAVRDGKRIEWDHDYDIGYPLEYAPKVLKALLTIKGLKVYSSLYFHAGNNKAGDHVCIKPFIDLNGKMYEVGENKIFRCINAGNYFLFDFIRSLPLFLQELLIKINMKTFTVRFCRGTVDYYKTFITKNMGDVPCKIPVGYKELLTYYYGDDYMIPKKSRANSWSKGRSCEEWEKEEMKNAKKQVRKKRFLFI